MSAPTYTELMAMNWQVSAQGYLEIRVRRNGVLLRTTQHRLVMSEFLGRPLAAHEVVHHINGDKTDNRPENLEVTTRAAHAKMHDPFQGVDAARRSERLQAYYATRIKRPSQAPTVQLVCSECGIDFVRRAAQYRKSKSHGHRPACSIRCAGLLQRSPRSSP